MSDTVEFGGWPRPPRWAWVVAGAAAAAVLAGLVAALTGHTGRHRHLASSRPDSRAAAPAAVRGPHATVEGSAAVWPSATGACGLPTYLPRIHPEGHLSGVHGTVLVGGAALRRVTLGGAVSRPLPGLPGRGRLVTDLVAGPGAGFGFAAACTSPSGALPVYRITPRGAHPLGILADALIGGPDQAWAVTYPPPPKVTQVLVPLAGGRRITFTPDTQPVADTAAGLVVVAYHPLTGRRQTLELVDPATGAVLRRLGNGSPLGATGHVLLVSLPGCGLPLTHGTCTLGAINLTTGRRLATLTLPPGRVPVSDAVFGPGGTAAAFQLARARPDPRFLTELPGAPSDVAVLNLRTAGLDIVPDFEVPPDTEAKLAFDATGTWLLATVSDGDHGELLAWRRGMPGPALVASLPGALAGAPPLLPVPAP